MPFKEANANLERAREEGLRGLAAAHAAEKEAERLTAASEIELQASREAYANADRNTANLEFQDRVRLLAPFYARRKTLGEKHLQVLESHSALISKAIQADALAAGAGAFKTQWEGVVGQAVTDARGEFKLTLPTDKEIVLIASARRTLGDNTEFYYWAWTVAREDSRPVLSNHNLLTTTVRSE